MMCFDPVTVLAAPWKDIVMKKIKRISYPNNLGRENKAIWKLCEDDSTKRIYALKSLSIC